MSTDSITLKKTYNGSCHCKKFTFEFKSPEILKLVECNCSICTIRGYLFGFSDRKNFNFISGSFEELTNYQFGKKKWSHPFCPSCGTGIAAFSTENDSVYVNVRSLENFETNGLQVDMVDGASRPL